MKKNMVKVYNNNLIVGEIEYNNNLDFWNGNDWTCGSPGRHKGLAKLKNNYILIYGTTWENEKTIAEVISEEKAVQEILKSNNLDLFKTYPDLQKIREGLKPTGKNTAIYIRVTQKTKNKWKNLAEASGISLSDFIHAAVEKFSKL